MTDFLSTYHLQGLGLGLCSFLIIGICHPIVIKGEYHYGQPFKWVFLLAGVVLCIGSLLVNNVMLSALMGVGAFSCFWGIKEMKDQQELEVSDDEGNGIDNIDACATGHSNKCCPQRERHHHL